MIETRDLERKLAAILYADVVEYSRLTSADEEGTHRRLSSYLDDISEAIETRGGRVVHYAGDAVLADFSTVTDALDCAIAVQARLAKRNSGVPDEQKLRFRNGVNFGEVIVDRNNIYGDGVNFAARLEGLAAPGGICISETVHTAIGTRVPLSYEYLGEREVKNIEAPIRVYQVKLEAADGDPTSPKSDSTVHQEVRFCTSTDGVGIAYSVVGEGPPLVKAANWLNHLEFDWESPIWRHLLRELSSEHALIRYDARGNGLSDWDVEDISFDGFVRDLEAVVDAVGLERFPLFGVSQGCAVSVAYAVRHPERVSKLILYCGFSRGRRKRGLSEEREESDALLTLMRQGWGKEDPAFRQIFTPLFIPGANREQMEWFNELQRMTTSGENAIRLRKAVDEIDVTELLGQVRAPTLVLHCRGDAVQPFQEGRRMAAMIPNARFVTLDGQNHLMLESDPAWRRFKEEVRVFLSEEERISQQTDSKSPRGIFRSQFETMSTSHLTKTCRGPEVVWSQHRRGK